MFDNPLIAVAAGTDEVPHARLRGGPAHLESPVNPGRFSKARERHGHRGVRAHGRVGRHDAPDSSTWRRASLRQIILLDLN